MIDNEQKLKKETSDQIQKTIRYIDYQLPNLKDKDLVFGIAIEVLNKIKDTLYRINSLYVNPTNDDLLRKYWSKYLGLSK